MEIITDLKKTIQYKKNYKLAFGKIIARLHGRAN